jgi:hypothetical protein
LSERAPVRYSSLLLLLAFALPGAAVEPGGTPLAFHPLASGDLLGSPESPRRFGLGTSVSLLAPGKLEVERLLPQDLGPAPPPRKLSLTGPTLGVTGKFLAGSAVGGYFLWWQRRKIVPFDTWSEGWFGENTYAGGADKTSHFVLGYIGGRYLQHAYEKTGHSSDGARLLSVAGMAAAALLVEVVDGFTGYRFCWEDATITTAGAVTGALIDRAGLGDTLGFRTGRVPTHVPKDPNVVTEGSVSYHFELYSLDVHLSGLLPRLGVAAGPGRFFLFSLTYNTRGYGFVRDEFRQRNIGLDVGLDLPEIARALGVREERFPGKQLLFVLRYFRLPFTAVGFRYDLNHRRFHGPDGGEGYSP